VALLSERVSAKWKKIVRDLVAVRALIINFVRDVGREGGGGLVDLTLYSVFHRADCRLCRA
jgi:hypothetical protein